MPHLWRRRHLERVEKRRRRRRYPYLPGLPGVLHTQGACRVPELPKIKRPPLKVHPNDEQLLESAVRSLERIAQGLTSVVETIDALVEENEHGQKCLRMAKQ